MDKGAVGPVFDAGSCKSSWAIAVSESLTALYEIDTGDLTPMSP